MIQIPFKFVSNVLIANKSALVQVMVWHRSGDKSLLVRILSQFIEADMGHQRTLV